MKPGKIQTATATDRLDVAGLIHASTNAWYEGHGEGPAFRCAPDDCAVYFDTYQALEQSQCRIIRDRDGGALLGSCFVHPRTTHWSLGIMNVAPAAFGHGVAGRLLDDICGDADRAGRPLRLVSSARNLDSFSLYNSRGFAPIQVFQDVLLDVPAGGLTTPATRLTLRPGSPADVASLTALESEVHGLERPGDLQFFAADPLGCFRLFVAEDRHGIPQGWLASVRHPATAMLGPGAAVDEHVAFALTCHALDAHHRGGTCLWLVPSECTQLVQDVRRLGARNVELHLAQVRHPRDADGRPLEMRPHRAPTGTGVVFPTFLPETG